jgi:hypothetical protein
MYPMTSETAFDTIKRFCRRLHANLKTGQVFYDPLLDVSDPGTGHQQQAADPELGTGGHSQVRTTHQRRE